MVVSKYIKELQDEKYFLEQNPGNISDILDNCDIDNQKIEDLTPYSMNSVAALLIWSGDGYYEEVWAIFDFYCALQSEAYLVYRERGI